MIKSLRLWLAHRSLYFKLSISILTCVIAGFFALLYFISERAEPIIASQIKQNAEKSVEAYVSDFGFLVSDTERVILNAKNALNQVRETDLSALEMMLSSAIKTVDKSELSFTNAWVYVFSPEDVSKGTLYISKQNENKGVSFKSEEIKNFYDKFPWFKEVPKVEEIYWSEPYIDKDTSNIVITSLLPFMFEGQTEFNGLMALTVDLSDIQKSINSFSFYETGKLLLLSKNGLYVTHPDKNIELKMTIFELGQKMNLPELIETGNEIKAGHSGFVAMPYSSVFHDEVVFFYAPIKGIHWGICLVYAKSEFLKPIRQFQISMIIAFIGGILVLLLIINVICRLSTNQLFDLSKIAIHYGQGDFSKSFDKLPSSKEISILSKALKNMRENLLSYVEKEKKEASEKQRIESEMNIASSIQNSATHKAFPFHPSFLVSAVMTPAKQVGGDFYDFFFLGEDKVGLVMADVSGKGIPAALYMMRGQALIKNIAKSGFGISEVFHLVNKELYEGNETCMFISAFLTVIDLKTGVMQYVNAGHTPLLIDEGDGYKYLKTERNIVLGVQKDAPFKAESRRLKPGSKIFLYTDGVTEAENTAHQFYGEQRLLDILSTPYETPQKTMDAVMKDIQKFADGNAQSDDITMMEFVYLRSSFDELKVSADVKNLSKVLNFIKESIQRYHLSDEVSFKMVTAAEEIFANIALYAYDNNQNQEISVKTHFDGTFYHIKFSDSGKEYNPLARTDPDVSAPLSDRSVGGLGIFLVKKFADDVTYTRQNNQNILKISIKV